MHQLNENQLAQWRGKTIGVVFQFFQLLPTLTVIENVMLPMDFCRMFTAEERPERALHLLEQVEMADQAYKLPGGALRRTAAARRDRSCARERPADHSRPTSPPATSTPRRPTPVFGLFERLVDEGKTIIMVTHDNDIAKRVRRSLHVHDGEIVEERIHHLESELASELAEENGDRPHAASVADSTAYGSAAEPQG